MESSTTAGPVRLGLLIFVSLLLIAALDFHTEQKLVFLCAYLIPVLLTAWHFSREAMGDISRDDRR